MIKMSLPEGPRGSFFDHFNRILRVSEHKMSINSSHLLDFGALGEVSDIEGSYGTFISQNWRFVSTGARFLKPVRARTGSELQRERVLSLGIKRELGRESEKTRREAKQRITTRYLIPSYTRAWRHENKTASRLESPRA